MVAYLIGSYSITDQEKIEQYRIAVIPTLLQYKGKVLAAGSGFDILEGEPQQVVVVLEFESKEAINTWFTSEEYSAIKHLREEATDGAWMIVTDQFVLPT